MTEIAILHWGQLKWIHLILMVVTCPELQMTIEGETICKINHRLKSGFEAHGRKLHHLDLQSEPDEA